MKTSIEVLMEINELLHRKPIKYDTLTFEDSRSILKMADEHFYAHSMETPQIFLDQGAGGYAIVRTE